MVNVDKYCLKVLMKNPLTHNWVYHRTSKVRRALVGNKIVDYPDVVGASPVGTAPTTTKFWYLVRLILEIWRYIMKSLKIADRHVRKKLHTTRLIDRSLALLPGNLSKLSNISFCCSSCVFTFYCLLPVYFLSLFLIFFLHSTHMFSAHSAAFY